MTTTSSHTERKYGSIDWDRTRDLMVLTTLHNHGDSKYRNIYILYQIYI